MNYQTVLMGQVAISMMVHVRSSQENESFVSEAVSAIDDICDTLPGKSRDKVALLVAARLCERAAFANAGDWKAASVADLLLLSAQLERFLIDDRQLD